MEAWLVDLLQREERRQEPERPRLEIPLPYPEYEPKEEKSAKPERGVVVIQVWGSDD